MVPLPFVSAQTAMRYGAPVAGMSAMRNVPSALTRTPFGAVTSMICGFVPPLFLYAKATKAEKTGGDALGNGAASPASEAAALCRFKRP